MRRLRNTIYVTQENAWLRKDGDNVVLEIEGKEQARVPMHMLDGIVTFSRVGASPALMHACADTGITISHLDPNGRFLARVEGPRTGNVLLRRAQYRLARDEPQATYFACFDHLVAGSGDAFRFQKTIETAAARQDQRLDVVSLRVARS